MIDRETVIKVAELAKLELTEEEVELFARQLTAILDFVNKMNEVDTEGVDPFVPEVEETPMREDEPGPTLAREEVEKNAPEFENGYFVVPRIFSTE
ncbi:MAG: Asp-tRNA(Asn)/Glu-tRNA(Gln) amidotransferase subunit GatC [Aquificae bacterium]|nr:Asp-tRNA(Asn)/Glu-tRNA(Gln) amidotransferase subunit GatC [Aquificota bacterium]